MKFLSFIVTAFTAAAIVLTSAALAAAQTETPSDSSQTQSDSSNSGGASFSAQPSTAPAPGIRGQDQGDKDHALEIAPQSGLIPRDKGATEIPSDKAYQPHEDTASLDRNFNPGGEATGKRRKLPYLGITVDVATKCFLGKEEHGLEIFSVAPNSPAEHAGLRASRNGGAEAFGMVGALAGPLSMILNRYFEKSELAASGDLIVAVNDNRIRTELDLEDELAKLKPGDTMYLTVLRPLPGGAHQSLKIAVKVGEPSQTVANGGSVPPLRSSSDAEEYAY